MPKEGFGAGVKHKQQSRVSNTLSSGIFLRGLLIWFKEYALIEGYWSL